MSYYLDEMRCVYRHNNTYVAVFETCGFPDSYTVEATLSFGGKTLEVVLCNHYDDIVKTYKRIPHWISEGIQREFWDNEYIQEYFIQKPHLTSYYV